MDSGLRMKKSLFTSSFAILALFCCCLLAGQTFSETEVQLPGEMISGLKLRELTLKELIREYDAINNELVDDLDSDEADANLIAAIAWFDKLMAERRINLSEKKRVRYFWQKDPGELAPFEIALYWFTALLQLIIPDRLRCDMKEYDILVRNERAAGVKIMIPLSWKDAERRIEKVIHDVGMAHADMCRYEYPMMFKKVRMYQSVETMDEINLLMRTIINTSKRKIFENKKYPMDPRQFLCQKAAGVSVTGKDEAQAALQVLRQLAMNDQDGKWLRIRSDPRKHGSWIVDEGKVREMTDSYIFARCEYLDKFAGDIMRPAQYEQQVYEANDKYRAFNDATAEFMLWLEFYRLCTEMVANKEKFKSNIVKAVWANA